MMRFTYKARDARGKAVSSTIEAENQPEALRRLQHEGLVVTEIRLGSSAPVDVNEIALRQSARQIGREEVISFASQLSVMLETGVPLAEALGAFTSQTKCHHLKRIMAVIDNRITGGIPFSEAIAEFPRVFPRTMISLMRASEASGTMGTMLGRIAEYLAKERKTTKQIKGALTYPLIMVLLALVVTVFLVIGVLPRFASIYESRSAALPTPTKIVLAISEALTGHWVYFATGLASFVAFLLWMRLTVWGRRLIDSIKIQAPVIGPMFRQFYLTRATRTLGTLLASGVTLLDGVRIVRGVTNNVHWEELWLEVEETMTAGKPVSTAIVQSNLIPASIASMIAAGERTGRLPEVLERVARSTEEDLDVAIKSATQLIEPAMIIFMGVTIGGIAIALLLPIFKVANIMSG